MPFQKVGTAFFTEGKLMKSNQSNKQLVRKVSLRTFCVLFLVALCVFCSCHNRGDENKGNKKKEITSFKLSDVGLNNYYNIDYFENKIYALQEEGVYVINLQDFSTEGILRVDKKYCYSKIYENFIYLTDQSTGKVFQFEFDGETIGNLSDSYYISENLYRVYCMSISEKYICAKVLLVDANNMEDDASEHDHGIIEKIFVIDSIKCDEIRTKTMAELLKALNVKKALIVLNENDQNVICSSRNIPDVKTALTNTINTYDILKYDSLVIDKAALETIEEVYA